jgi:ribonuclease HI
MGIGWVQVDSNDQVIHKFAAKVHLWPSFYKAELFSILSAISTASRNSTINIYTDSQSIISKFIQLNQSPLNLNKLFKFNSWPLWHTLLNIIKSYKLNIIFHKVQAHSDNTLNNLADSLAKQHINESPLYFNYTNIHNPYHLLFFETEKFPVELPTRYFVKSICKAYNLALWSSQKRNDE